LKKIKPLADSKKATISQLVIKWTIEQPGITVALVGARNSQQAIENASAGKIDLSKEDLLLLNTELAKLKLA
jgi:aryl-alcohol dehydrogenase-like predicted oxidoreductase